MSTTKNTPSLSRRQLLQLSSSLMLAPWLTACSQPSPLIIAGHRWPGYEILFMARDLGWLPFNNLEFFDTLNPSASMQALREGKVQAAMLTLDEMIRLCSEGFDLRVALIFDISVGADAVIAKPEVNTLNNLSGKTIGYEPGALGSLMLHEVLNYALIDPSEVNLVKVNVDQHEVIWSTGQLDALITFEPIATKLVNVGGRRLFDSRQIPDKIFDVLVVTADAAKQHRDTLHTLIKIYFQALHHFRTNPMDASYRIAKRLDMPAESVLHIFRGLLIPDVLTNHAYLSKQDTRMVEAAIHLIKVMRDAGMIVDDCDLRTIFTNEFIPKDIL